MYVHVYVYCTAYILYVGSKNKSCWNFDGKTLVNHKSIEIWLQCHTFNTTVMFKQVVLELDNPLSTIYLPLDNLPKTSVTLLFAVAIASDGTWCA